MSLLAGRVRGQAVGALVIGLIYLPSLECRLHQLAGVITGGGGNGVYGVWMVVGLVITLSSRHFPPVTRCNEAQKRGQTLTIRPQDVSFWFLSPAALQIPDLISAL